MTGPGPLAEHRTLGQMLRRAAEHETGVRFLDRDERPTTFGYAELLRRAERVAAGLVRRGLRPGDRVALVLPTAPSFYDAFFGATLAGLVPVPLYPPVRLGLLEEYHRRTAAMIEACGARLVVSDDRIRRILGAVILQARPALGVTTGDALSRAGRAATFAETSPDDLAFVQFSSGTTRAPKPIALTHRQVLANVAQIAAAILDSYPEGPALVHRGVCWLPLYHDMGLVGCVLVAMSHPGELTLIPPELFIARPAVWLRAISRYRGTISPAPNFAYGLCAQRVRDDELNGVDLSSWRFALNGAEPVTPAVLRRFVDRFAARGFRPETLTPVYGLAEAALAVTFSEIRRPFEARSFDPRALAGPGRVRLTDADGGLSLVNLGRPLPGFSLRIADDAGAALPADRLGRVLVRGPSVMQGYLGQPEATAAVLAAGWLDTGDEGFLHGGDLFIYGRNKDVIILNGENHSPAPIEQSLDGLPGFRVGCSAAVGHLPPGGDGEQLVVLLERARSATAGGDAALAEEAAARICEHTGLRAARVQVLAPGTLPRTSSGKIRRAAARRRFAAGTLTPPAPVTPLRVGLQLAQSAVAYLRARVRAALIRGLAARLVK